MRPTRFAEGTSVPVEKSRAEIETLLKRHGAGAFMTATDADHGVSQIGFRMGGSLFRIEVRQPRPEEAPPASRQELSNDPRAIKARNRYTTEQERARKEQERRLKWAEGEEKRRWRAQLLLVKAKLETIATGSTTAEREFLADMVLPGGKTVSNHLAPQLSSWIAKGKPMPFMLGDGGER